MIRFNNDYNHGAHPEILEALLNTNNESFEGYGMDSICDQAKEEIKALIKAPKADVHFLVGGTQTNATVITAALRPYQSVISADSGHINQHETGAIEHSGHKILSLPSTNGKITAKQIAKEAEEYSASGIKEHITQPKMVYLSFPTELGSLYTKNELTEIRAVCNQYGLYLFIDGARMGYAFGSPACDLTPAELASLCDVFYFGGTKCGALFGEAIVIMNDFLKEDFRSYIKMKGGMLAKGWLLGLQFHTLFKDGLYFKITKHAIDQAMALRAVFERKGFYLYSDSPTNQQFIVVNTAQMQSLSQKFNFEYQENMGNDHHAIRFCTSWSTTDQEVHALIEAIETL
jgi:threonine aldolase